MQSQVEFFSSVLSEQGRPCLAWLVPAEPKPYFKHLTFDNIEQFAAALQRINFQRYNYYFCISTLREKTIKVGGKDRVRIQQNAQLTRVFVLDVDIRDDKPGFYTNFDDALAGVEVVRAAFNMPQPTIINSGFGLHVYWPMAEGVESKLWMKIAHKFKRAIETIAPEVVADGSRVSDSAGVLRVPLSFNLKSDPATPVEFIQTFDEYLDFGTFSNTLNRIIKDDGPKTVDIGTTVVDSGPTDLAAMVKKCNWSKEYLKNKATASEPEWYAMLGLAPYLEFRTKQGATISKEKVAHLLSQGHNDYDPEATYLKYAQVSAAQTGPTTCNKFRSINPERCKGCPFADTVKTPLQVARLDVPATEAEVVTAVVQDEAGNKSTEEVTIPLPPSPYFRGESGGIYVRTKVKQENGTWDEVINRIYDYDFYPTKRLRTEATENEAMEIHLWLPHDGLKKFRLPSGLLAEAKKLNQYLSDKGVIAEFNKAAHLCKYLVDYIRHLQMNHAAEIEFSRFGWRDTFSTDPKFVVGGGYINKEGKLVPAGVAPFLKEAGKATEAKGEIGKWKQAFSVYADIPDSDPYILASMLGFAAPLMALTEYSGVLYNIVGQSGAGKSTAMKFMTSVWGEPTSNHVLVNDTDNSIYNQIGYLASVPVAFDEVTKMEGDRLSNFVLSFTGGRGKMRATREGNNKVNETFWDTIVCSTSNTSLYDKLANARRGYNAEAMRIFELNIQPSHPEYKVRLDRALQVIKENYGIAGREYIKYVLPRATQIKAILEKAIDGIVAKGKLRNEERFWGALLACVLVGGKISRDALKLHSYDVENLVNRTLGQSDEVRTVVKTSVSDPISTLSEFINTNLSAIVRINDGQLDLVAMNGQQHAIKARLEYVSKQPYRGYISIQSIREYCNLRKIDPSWLRKELQDIGVIINSNLQKRLTTGTNLPGLNLKVWEIDLTHEALVKSIEELPIDPTAIAVS